MGLFDSIQQLATQQLQGQGADQSNIAGAIMQTIQERPGGVQGVLESFQQNGLGDHVQELASGQATTTTPDQVQQGLGDSGFVESVAEKAGVSPQVAQMAVTTLLPMVLKHFAPNGEAAPEGAFGGLAQQLLGKLL